MKIEARPVYLGNSFTVWIGNYRLMFQGTEEEAERIAPPRWPKCCGSRAPTGYG